MDKQTSFLPDDTGAHEPTEGVALNWLRHYLDTRLATVAMHANARRRALITQLLHAGLPVFQASGTGWQIYRTQDEHGDPHTYFVARGKPHSEAFADTALPPLALLGLEDYTRAL